MHEVYSVIQWSLSACLIQPIRDHASPRLPEVAYTAYTPPKLPAVAYTATLEFTVSRLR